MPIHLLPGSAYSALSSTNDPIRFVRRRALATWLTGGAALVPVAYWALRPLPKASAPVPALPTLSAESSPAEEQRIDPSVFAVTLWSPRPPAPTTPPAVRADPSPAPAPPLKLQLIGIVAEPAISESEPPQFRAALYDPETDRLYLVAPGEHVGIHRIGEITAHSVTVIAAGRQTPSRLQLKQSRQGELP